MSSVLVLSAFIRRDLAIDLSYRAPFALRILATLSTLALFYYLGEIVDNEAFARDEVDSGYFGFVAIGLALFTVVQVSVASFSRKLQEEQTTGTFEALMATPASPSLIILSSAAYELLRALIDGFAMVLIAVVVFGLDLETDPGALALGLVALIGSLGLFAALGVVVAALTVLYKRTVVLVSLVMTTLGLLAGVYFPLDVLPDPIKQLGEALPFTWAIDLLRASLLGGDRSDLALAGIWLSVAVLLPLSLVSFKAAVDRARRTGTLAQY
jgi:ABC-2 type transport system permease protein